MVVWEPVLITDRWPPTSRSLRRVSDARARQFWDKPRLLSKAMGEKKDDDSIVWDVAAVYPPGAVWTDAGLPKPVFQEGTVIDVEQALSDAVRQARQ